MKPSSTSAMAQDLLNEPEIQDLIVQIGRRFPRSEAEALVSGILQTTLSTIALSGEYGPDRESGLEAFKRELRIQAGKRE